MGLGLGLSGIVKSIEERLLRTTETDVELSIHC